MHRQPLCAYLLLALLPALAIASDWPHWRGPHKTGAAPGSEPPATWAADKNIKWRVKLPGLGHATPLVVDNRVIVLSAVPTDPDAAVPQRAGAPRTPHEFQVAVHDLKTGAVLWKKTAVTASPHERLHPDSSLASASPATDGERIYAYFGSFGLFCYTLEGELLWKKDFGEMQTRRGFGEGSSPAVHDGVVVVKWDHEQDDFIVALDAKSGAEKWRRVRDEPTSWSTPLIVEVNGRPQVIASATNRSRGYDLRTGKELWELGGQTLNAIPTPVFEDGVVYLMSGFRGNTLQAVSITDAKGDLTTQPDLIRWTHDKDTPYVPSPLLYDGKLYFLKRNNGILSCWDADAGERHYMERLPEIKGVYASPVGADGKVYVVGRDGVTVVVKAGAQFEVVAINRLDDIFDASPVIAGDALLLRGHDYLYCIAE